ncbi:MAG TPA: hypothetical protein VGK59_10260 [Ohtaekwangia sp.]
MHTVDFKTSGYFTFPFFIVSGALMIIGLPVLFESWLVGTILLVISITIFTTHYRVRIDLVNKTYHDYLWIWGMKHGEKGRFEIIEYIFIKKATVSQPMRAIAASSTVRKEVFDAYLKFSDHAKIHLLTGDNKKTVMDKVNGMASRINVTVVDYTAETR